MARPRKNREISIIHFSFFNMLFGAFGAFVFMMIMQVLASINLVDADARQIVDKTVREKDQLKHELLQYQRLDQTLGSVQAQYQQAQTERDAVREQNRRLRAELDALQQRWIATHSAQRQEIGDTLRALEQDKRKLEEALEQVERKLAAFKTLPLRIKTQALPTTLTDENVQLALTAEGGWPPYRWEMKGALPPGLSLDPGAGLITGVIQSPGDFQFTLKVTDTQGLGAETQIPVAFKVVRQFEEQSRKIFNGLSIVAGTVAGALLFFVHKLWQDRRVRRRIKEMEAQGFQLRWVK